MWWFSTSVDREHTFEGIARFFDAAGGVPKIARTDRMGALGQSQGRRFVLHPPTLEFARHHGVEIKACQAGDAKRKGKIERPFRDLKESFLARAGRDRCARPHRRAQRPRPSAGSIDRVHDRVPSQPPGSSRRSASRPSRASSRRCPVRRFDTDYVETRRVHRALPFITWDGVRYSVPPTCLGQTVEVRQAVDSTELTSCRGPAGSSPATASPGAGVDRGVGPGPPGRRRDRGAGQQPAPSPPRS